MEVTPETIAEKFPYGATMARSGDAPNVNLIDLEIHDDEGQLVVLGWAYPNKDFYVYPKDVEEDSDGDWVFTSRGSKVRFAPLTKEEADLQRDVMRGA